MAIGVPVLRASNNNAGASSITTTTLFNPTANSSLVVQLVGKSNTISVPTGSVPTDNAGGTWVPITNGISGTGPSLRQLTYRRAIGPSPPVNMTVTWNIGTVIDSASISVFELSGANAVPTNIISATSTAGDPAPVLPNTPAVSSTVIAFFGGRGTSGAGVPIPANYIQINTATAPGNHRYTSYYDANNAAVNATWTTTCTQSVAALIEWTEVVTSYTGSGVGTLASITGVAAGTEVLSGTGVGAVNRITGIATGTHGNAGLGVGTINRLVGVANGNQVISGVGVASVNRLAGVGFGSAPSAGSELLLEDGTPLLLESGEPFLLEVVSGIGAISGAEPA